MKTPLSLLPLPLGSALVLFVCCYSFELDFAVADLWFHGDQFGWKHDFWLETVLHRGARSVHLLLLLTLLAGYGWLQWRNKAHGPQRPQLTRALGVLLLSVSSCLALVAMLKQWIPMDCPWDLRRYGGVQPFTGLLSAWPVGRAPNACFPAGHASIGYAWLGLYFFASSCIHLMLAKH